MRWFAKPDGEDVPNRQAPRPAPVAGSGPLPSLPPGSMAQRCRAAHAVLPPATHSYRGGWEAAADLPAVSNRVLAALRPAFQLDPNVPLFRDDNTTWEQFEQSRMARVHRMQQMTEDGWPDAHGVNLGTGQSPKTLVFSTSLYERFSDGTGVQPAVSR